MKKEGQRPDGVTRKPKFELIQAGRGIAALLVVLHHAGSMLGETRFYGVEPFAQHFRNFNVGVDFFFVLSGFIITWVHWKDLGHPEELGDYAAKRFLRIFPPYWGILLPLVLLHFAFPDPLDPSKRDLGHILVSTFLLPSSEHPILGVAWTLTYEIFFYVLFAALIAKGRFLLHLLGLWVVAIIGTNIFSDPAFPLSFLLSPYHIEFVMGVVAAILLRQNDRLVAPLPMLLGGIICFLGLMLFATHIQDVPLRGRLAFGLTAMLMVIGAVELERRHIVHVPRAFSLLGAASYSIYLIHPLALLFAAHVLRLMLGRLLPIELAVLVMAVTAVVAGCFYHLLVERRLASVGDRWRRHLLAGRSSALTRRAMEEQG